MIGFKTTILLLLLALFSATAGDRNYGNATVGRIVSVYDGDTFRCDIPKWPAIIGQAIRIRVAGIDTPKIWGTRDRERERERAARVRVRSRPGQYALGGRAGPQVERIAYLSVLLFKNFCPIHNTFIILSFLAISYCTDLN